MHTTISTPLPPSERLELVEELKKLTARGMVLLAADIGFSSESNPIVILSNGQACGWTGAQSVEQLSDPELRLARARGALHPAGSLALREALELDDASDELIHWVDGGPHPRARSSFLFRP